jgi:tRNA dimethylallyltransferase
LDVVEPLSKILVIAGPTGSGKGELARQLAVRFNGELISADSRKIYHGLDIGTAKPTAAMRRAVAYHLIDVCSPGERFSAATFCAMARVAIADIRARGKVPIVVGGTGLYVRAVLYGLIDTPRSNELLRSRLEAEEQRDPGCLYRRLLSVDPVAAARLRANDRMRVIRALEVYELTGRPLTVVQREHGFAARSYRAWQVAPHWPRAELYRRINERVDRMLDAGWLDEVKRLRREELAAAPALRVVGYRELGAYLDGQRSWDETYVAIQRAHRRYARRQLTWFRAVPEINWWDAPINIEELAAKAREFLEDGC